MNFLYLLKSKWYKAHVFFFKIIIKTLKMLPFWIYSEPQFWGTETRQPRNTNQELTVLKTELQAYMLIFLMFRT